MNKKITFMIALQIDCYAIKYSKPNLTQPFCVLVKSFFSQGTNQNTTDGQEIRTNFFISHASASDCFCNCLFLKPLAIHSPNPPQF